MQNNHDAPPKINNTSSKQTGSPAPQAEKLNSRNHNKDISSKHLLSYPDVFADVMNLIDDFAPLNISEDKLQHLVTRLPVLNMDNDLHEIERDVSMEQIVQEMENGDKYYLRLGIENQSSIDSYISLRTKSYNGVELSQMLLEKKKGAVLTIVLYFGIDKPWPQAKSVGESLQNLSPVEVQNIPEIKTDSDFRVRVIDLGGLSNEQIDCLQSDLHDIAVVIKALRNKEEVPQLNHPLKHVEETIRTMTALLNSRSLAEEMLISIKKKGKNNMTTLETFRPIISKRDQDYFFSLGEGKGKTNTLNMVNAVTTYLKKHGREHELSEHSDLAGFIEKVYDQEIKES